MSSSSEELHDISWDEPDPFFDYTDPYILSPQHAAVINNDIGLLRELLKSGKSVNIIDNLGNTPLHVSILNEKKEIFDYLLTLDDIRRDSTNFLEITPLMMAIIHNREYYAVKLIENGCDVNCQNKIGDSALHLAVGKNTKIALALLENGARINCQNEDGETPLHVACKNGYNDFVYILLYYGALATICDNSRELPFRQSLYQTDELLQEILFDHTFDEKESEVRLSFLSQLMVDKSVWFSRVLDRTSRLIYDDHDLETFAQDLPMFKAEMFKRLFEKFPDFVVGFFGYCNPLTGYVNYLFPDNDLDNIVESIYILAEITNLGDFVNKDNEFLARPLILASLPEVTLSKVLLTLLSYGFDMFRENLVSVYLIYGYCELFKILLHMPIKDFGERSLETSQMFFIPLAIYDVSMRLETFSAMLQRDRDMEESCRNQVSKFFAIGKPGTVPSLLELGRNATREHLIDRFKIKNNVEFFTLIKWLPVAEIYKSILTFERQIYQ